LASKKSHEHPAMGIYALHGNLHSYWLFKNQMDVFCGNLQSDWLVYYKMVRWLMMSLIWLPDDVMLFLYIRF
jgi:hypothetical protein